MQWAYRIRATSPLPPKKRKSYKTVRGLALQKYSNVACADPPGPPSIHTRLPVFIDGL